MNWNPRDKKTDEGFLTVASEFDVLTDDWSVKAWFIPSTFSCLPSLLLQTA
jgi:hypothetical protein